MTPLEVAIVCFSSIGGSGTVAVELAHALGVRGHRVRVIAEGRPPRLHDATSFVPVGPITHPLFRHTPYALALAGTIVEAHRARPIDVVHFHYGVPHAASALLVRQTLGDSGPALVLTLHGTDVTTLGERSGEVGHAAVTGACVRALDALTTPSRFLEARASAAFGVAPEVVPNFVDPSVFRPEAARPELLDAAFGASAGITLVHVSSFRAVKATRTLVPLLARLARTVPGGARLVLVGDGPDRASVEADARAAGVADRIRSVPAPGDPETIAAWVAACDLFVLPSESESFGLAALEALACGTPVVARRVGGVPEVVRDGAAGRLVDDPAELAGAIEALAAAPEARRAMGREAVRDARSRFSPEVVVGGYQAVYDRAIEARRSRPRRGAAP